MKILHKTTQHILALGERCGGGIIIIQLKNLTQLPRYCVHIPTHPRRRAPVYPVKNFEELQYREFINPLYLAIRGRRSNTETSNSVVRYKNQVTPR